MEARRLGVPLSDAVMPVDFARPMRRVKRGNQWLHYFAQRFSATTVVEHGFEYVGDVSASWYDE